MLLSLIYLILQAALRLVRGNDQVHELEIVVLRHS